MRVVSGACVMQQTMFDLAVQAKAVGLVRAGDKVVISQCPRTGYSDVMEEAGVVKLITVDDTDDQS